MHILHVDTTEQGMKLIGFLARRLGGSVSQGDLHRWIRTGQVRVNKGRAKAFDRLTAGDAVRLPPFASSLAKEMGEDIPVAAGDNLGSGVTVLAAHPDFLALEKPPFLPTQPGTGHDISLVSILREHFAAAPYIPAPAHRLDAATGGIVLAGRSHEAQEALHSLFAAHGNAMEKTYLAWVAGNWPYEGETSLADRLLKEENEKFERVVTSANGKEARSRVTPLARRGDKTLLQIVLETGRTHQIRVQLSSRSHPVIGDAKYGGPCHSLLLLHAVRLRFAWKGETVSLLSYPRWGTPFWDTSLEESAFATPEVF